MPLAPDFRPATSHAGLGSEFYDPVDPADFPAHTLRRRNQRWAERIGLGDLSDAEWLDHFGRFHPLPGSFEKPLALRYHGHQFRAYNPDLGDGRGFLFAQLHDLRDGRLLDLGTKGSGRTPWSRGGDGKLTLKGGVREVLATEMLEALGVDTSKSLSLVETGEELMRGDEPSPTRSSVLVRLSHSHIRIGTFQRLLFHENVDAIGDLLDYVIRTYMSDLWRDDIADRAIAFVDEVASRVAQTGAAWTAAGFVHGVLNSDNINVTGESFDYGPWRFLPHLDPAFTAAYFDQTGLYAFGRQPDALLWNLARLAECLLPLTRQADLERILGDFEARVQTAFASALLRRLGLKPRGMPRDGLLAAAWWSFLASSKAPYEQAFFDWRGGLASEERAASSPSAAHYASEAFAAVRSALDGYEAQPQALSHPYFSGRKPCTMLIDDVEAVWERIAEADDWSHFEETITAIGDMRAAYGLDFEPPHLEMGGDRRKET